MVTLYNTVQLIHTFLSIIPRRWSGSKSFKRHHYRHLADTWATAIIICGISSDETTSYRQSRYNHEPLFISHHPFRHSSNSLSLSLSPCQQTVASFPIPPVKNPPDMLHDRPTTHNVYSTLGSAIILPSLPPTIAVAVVVVVYHATRGGVQWKWNCDKREQKDTVHKWVCVWREVGPNRRNVQGIAYYNKTSLLIDHRSNNEMILLPVFIFSSSSSSANASLCCCGQAIKGGSPPSPPLIFFTWLVCLGLRGQQNGERVTLCWFMQIELERLIIQSLGGGAQPGQHRTTWSGHRTIWMNNKPCYGKFLQLNMR